MNAEKATYSVNECAEILGISAPSLYKLIHEISSFPVLRVGKRILIPKAAFENWLNTPENYQKNKD